MSVDDVDSGVERPGVDDQGDGLSSLARIVRCVPRRLDDRSLQRRRRAGCGAVQRGPVSLDRLSR
jgi:hypothetical protein